MGLSMIVLLVAGFVASFYVRRYLRRQQRELEGGESAPDVARLQESVDELTTQVHLLEEEKDFYRELTAPQDRPETESDSEEELG